MGISKLFRLALACSALAIVQSSSALAASAEVYDGLNFDQFKAILSKANLALEERVTGKGNHYFVVAAPGMTVSFLATTADCEDGQKACSGYSYLAMPANSMDAAAMNKFNIDVPFLKATPSVDDPAQTVIKGQNFARGGVAEQQVISAAGFFAAVLQDYVNKSTPSAMNAPNSFVAQAARRPMQGDTFFRALAAHSPARPVYGVRVGSRVVETLIDEANGGLR